MLMVSICDLASFAAGVGSGCLHLGSWSTKSVSKMACSGMLTIALDFDQLQRGERPLTQCTKPLRAAMGSTPMLMMVFDRVGDGVGDDGDVVD